MNEGWTRRRFLVTGGTAAAGAAAVGLGARLLPFQKPNDSATTAVASANVDAEDFDPVALAAAMIRFDTSHDGEGAVTLPHARWMAAKWEAVGVQAEIITTPKADDVHCIARIAGTGSAPPLLYLGHSDVVSVERDRWTVDPFAGEVRNGFLYGRGALDMKGANAATMAALLRHLAEGSRFDRDIIFLSDTDEELGPYPAGWLAARHWDKVDAGAVLTEGGWFLAQRGGHSPMLATLTCQEKAFALVSVTTEGAMAHSARPRPDSAIVRLNRAIARLGGYEPDVFLAPLVRRHFEALAAATDDPGLAGAVRLLLQASEQNERNRAGRIVVARSPYPWLHNALIRPTVAFVNESSGHRANVVPGRATATINLRLPPGGPGVDEIVAAMRAVVADEGVTINHVGAVPGETPQAAADRVAMTIASPPAPYPQAADGGGDPIGVFTAWESAVRSVFPGTPVTPTVCDFGTSAGAWRARGIPVYGLYPYVVEGHDLERMHGNDERVGVDALRRGADLMYAFFSRYRA